MTETLAVKTSSLAKRFNDIPAVAGIDLEIEPGAFFGLLGPNGAGKTTTVSILATLVQPTKGEAAVFGHDVATARPEVRRSIGIVFQEPSLDTELTGRENLDIHARLYRIASRAREIDRTLDLVDMRKDADRPVKTLSGGMKRRLEIARGVLHQPKILFLDEPTLGLDVHGRRDLWRHLDGLRDSGMTLLLTTHAMDEAERICDRVAIMNEGRIAASGTPQELAAAVGGDRIEFELERAEEALTELRRQKGGYDAWRENDMVVLTVRQAATQLVAFVEVLKPFGIHAVRMREVNLEDAFVHFTGHKISASGDLE